LAELHHHIAAKISQVIKAAYLKLSSSIFIN